MEVGFLDFLNFLMKGGWVVLPILLFFVWKNLWMDYIHLKYDLSVNWVTLELRIPQVVDKTPKVMEQIFSGLYALRTKIDWVEKYIDGKHQPHISLDITSLNGNIHFFIRTPEQYRLLIESQVLAQYPEADLVEVEDYTKILPENIPNEDYDIWGTELKFIKEDAFPIRTYKNFKEDIIIDPNHKGFVDPIASLMEVMSSMREGENFWINYMIRPANDNWQKKGADLVDRLLGRNKKKKSSNIFEEVFQFFSDMVWILFGRPPEDKRSEEQEREKKDLSPGQRDVVKAVEESISKHGFHSLIRIVYIARRTVFSRANIPAIIGTFNQFSTYDLNGFKPDGKVTPGVDYFFKKTRDYLRKVRLYQGARRVRFSKKGIILNVEELATVWHIPSSVVETPTLPRIEAKKVQPPSGLPIM
jgi:hypothetical protein